MKTAILAVLLLLLAVASIVSGAPAESGKSLYGHTTYLAVTLQKLQLCKFVSLLNYELRHDVWRNAVKLQAF
jgi:hypothetical protein